MRGPPLACAKAAAGSKHNRPAIIKLLLNRNRGIMPKLLSLPSCSVTVGVRSELKYSAVCKLQFLKKPARRPVLGSQTRGSYFIAGFQAAAVFPAHSGPSKRAGAAKLKRPLLNFAVGIFNVYRQIGMRIDPLHFSH